MRTAGAAYPAFLEVAALSSGLTVSSIVGSRFALRCARKSSALNLSGLAASLLSLFFCIYGLTYWLNGIVGFDCVALAMVMSSCVSVSNALTFIHLFILSNSLYQASPRWKQFRWLGLLLTALNWGTLVVDELMITAEQEKAGIDGPRCTSHFEPAAFRLSWSMQLITETFQAVAFLLSLQLQPAGASRLRVLLSNGKGSAEYGRGFHFPITTKVDRSITAVVASLAMTIVTAGLALAKIGGRLHQTPIFAVEVMDNAVNLAAIFYAVHTPVPSKHLPKRRLPSKGSQRLDLGSANKRHRSMSVGGGGGSTRIRSRRVGSRLRGFGSGYSTGNQAGYGAHRGHGNGDGAVGGLSSSSSGLPFHYPHGSEPTSMLPLRSHGGPIKRLPPVLDMSPEVRTISSGNSQAMFSLGSSSPGGSAVAVKGGRMGTGRWAAAKQGSWRHQAGVVGPLFFTRNKGDPPQTDSSGMDTIHTRQASDQRLLTDFEAADSHGTKDSPSAPAEFAALSRTHGTAPPRNLAPQQPFPSGHTRRASIGVGGGATLAQFSTTGYAQTPAGYFQTPAGYPQNATMYLENRTGPAQNGAGYPHNPTAYPQNSAGYPQNSDDRNGFNTLPPGRPSSAEAAAAAAAAASTVVWPLPLPLAGRERLNVWVGRGRHQQQESQAAGEREEKRPDTIGEEASQKASQARKIELKSEKPPKANMATNLRVDLKDQIDLKTPEEEKIRAMDSASASTIAGIGAERSAPGARGGLGMGPSGVHTPPPGASRSVSSPSAGCRSVHAMSAFSAASWCSSSYYGDVRVSAPTATVRSPASYFGENGNV